MFVKTKFASSPLVYKLKHNLGLSERKYSASNPSLSRFTAQSLHTLVTQVTLTNKKFLKVNDLIIKLNISDIPKVSYQLIKMLLVKSKTLKDSFLNGEKMKKVYFNKSKKKLDITLSALNHL